MKLDLVRSRDSEESTSQKRAHLTLASFNATLILVSLGSAVPRLYNFSSSAFARVEGKDSSSALPTVPLETVDKIAWALMIVCAIAFIFLGLRNRSWIVDVFYPATISRQIIMVSLIAVSIGWVQAGGYPGLWYGFGMYVLILVGISIPIAGWIFFKSSMAVRQGLAIAFIALAVISYLPSVLQPSWGLSEPTHSSYVLNELLAAASGNWPLAEFVPQYTSMIGLPLAPIILALTHLGLNELVLPATTLYSSTLTVIELGIMVAVAFCILPRRIRMLAPGIILPFALLVGIPNDTSVGSIALLLSALPIRTLGPALITGVIVFGAGKYSWPKRSLVLGFIAGFMALNNYEFGLPLFAGTLLMVILRSLTESNPVRSISGFLSSSLSIVLAYWVLLTLVGQNFRPALGLRFILGFGSGFGSIEMPALGTYLVIGAILVSSTVISVVYLARHSKWLTANKQSRHSLRMVNAACVGCVYGISGIGSWAYYTARSMTPGQLQIFLIFAAPCIAATLSLVWDSMSNSRWRSNPIEAALLLVPVALAFSCVICAPNPQTEWARISFSNAVVSGSLPTNERTLSSYFDSVELAVASAQEELKGAPFDTSIDYGNIASSILGITNVSSIDVPENLWEIESLRQPYCARLSRSIRPVLVTDFYRDGSPACSGFKRMTWITPDMKWSLIEKVGIEDLREEVATWSPAGRTLS